MFFVKRTLILKTFTGKPSGTLKLTSSETDTEIRLESAAEKGGTLIICGGDGRFRELPLKNSRTNFFKISGFEAANGVCALIFDGGDYTAYATADAALCRVYELKKKHEGQRNAAAPAAETARAAAVKKSRTVTVEGQTGAAKAVGETGAAKAAAEGGGKAATTAATTAATAATTATTTATTATMTATTATTATAATTAIIAATIAATGATTAAAATGGGKAADIKKEIAEQLGEDIFDGAPDIDGLIEDAELDKLEGRIEEIIRQNQKAAAEGVCADGLTSFADKACAEQAAEQAAEESVCAADDRPCNGESAETASKRVNVANAEDAQAESVCADGRFYENVKRGLEEMLSSYPEDSALMRRVPNGRFVRVYYGESYYSVGVYYKNGLPEYICYGIPGRLAVKPYGRLKDISQWLPLDGEPADCEGYWLIYQNASTGAVIAAQTAAPPPSKPAGGGY
ncbi:MAG: hypothetical protein LBQ40_02565 [Clostridiales bacterium]|jgi:hypothetical protein|nr:hypothetical protein [Clostridiales bacterium]